MADVMLDALSYAQQYQMRQMQYNIERDVFRGLGMGQAYGVEAMKPPPAPMPVEPLPNKLLLLVEEDLP